MRDIRVRWALEEAGLPYRVESTLFRDRKAEHLTHQPVAQVPRLTAGRGLPGEEAARPWRELDARTSRTGYGRLPAREGAPLAPMLR